MINLEKEKVNLEEKRRKLKEKEKALKEKERRMNKSRINSIINMLIKAEIDHLDPEILLGAFLEIAENSLDNKNILKWKNSVKEKTSEKTAEQIIILFETVPSQEIKNELKLQKFRWNSFRGEYYGKGNKKILQELLKNQKCNIQVIE